MNKKKIKILFLHRNFPAQFRHLISHLINDPGYDLAFITNRKEAKLKGMTVGFYDLTRQVSEHTHSYLKNYEEFIIHGQGTARIAQKLKDKGFYPDVIIGHTWGQNLFIQEVFPDAPLIGYFEWFYNSKGSDTDFGKITELPLNKRANIRIKNSPILLDLISCRTGFVPTKWQKQQFPDLFHYKLNVIHDGIDTDICKPAPVRKGLDLHRLKLSIPSDCEIITYSTRGMEAYRGFPQFMEAVSAILKDRPEAHVVIAGEDRVCYGAQLEKGRSYKQMMTEKFPMDPDRIHFTGLLSYPEYLTLLQSSWVHVYLTYPFVLSWSMLEAMSSGCIVAASSTPPVIEVIRDNENGFLFDFFSTYQLAEKIIYVLENQDKLKYIRDNARKTICMNYDLKDCLKKQLNVIIGVISNRP